MKSILQCVMVIISCLATSYSYAQTNFLSIADIHFDPFSGCHASIHPCKKLLKLTQTDPADWKNIFSQYPIPPATIKQDTNASLFFAFIKKLKETNEKYHPEFALILGDFLVHNARVQYILYTHDTSHKDYQAFVKKIFLFLNQQIQSALPHLAIYPVLGNNDTDGKDYFQQPNSPFLQETAVTWSSFFKDTQSKKQFSNTFSQDGYYAIEPSTTNIPIRLILLNSVLFSTQARGPQIDASARKQIIWLHNQLQTAQLKKQRVIIGLHIPPGINVYLWHKQYWKKPPTFWKTEYTNAFYREVSKFSAIIDVILPAHIHRDSLSLLPVKNIANVPVYITPAISPIFGNDSEFRLFFHKQDTYRPHYIMRISHPLNSSTLDDWKEHQKLIYE